MVSVKNRRRHVRAPSAFDGIALGDRHAHCVVDGLSVGGARLVGVSAPVGTRIRVSIDLFGRPVLLHASVVRKELDAIGVRFDRLHPTMEDRIGRAVLRALEAYPVEPVVLIVESSAAIQLALAKDLRSLSYEVRSATSASEAAWILEDPSVCVQAVIVNDHLEPGLLKAIEDEYPQIRRVLLTSNEPQPTAPHCHAQLEMPWAKSTLAAVLW
jgi:hypothetical protein